MAKILLFAPALLGAIAFPACQDLPQAHPGQMAIASAAQITPQDGLNGKGNAPVNHQPIHASHARRKAARKPGRAQAQITVHSSEAKPYDQTASPQLMELHLDETFSGDINGESPVRALQIVHDDHSATIVSVQRFSGKLRGREGTFVLQGSEKVENGKITAKWFVVPGSGTGELAGLRGDGGFEGEFGKGSNGTLNYWFE